MAGCKTHTASKAAMRFALFFQHSFKFKRIKCLLPPAFIITTNKKMLLEMLRVKNRGKQSMRKIRQKLAIDFILITILLYNLSLPQSFASVSQVKQFGLFEAEFTSSNSYNNPYVDVSLSALVTSPSNRTFRVDGYWQGADRWKLRIMPTELGAWSFITSSNDPDLDSLSGNFTCIASSRAGMLMVNPDFPYSFKLSNGKPFFWMGETNWYLMSKAVSFADSTFHKYINKRRQQNFNGVHFVLGTGGLPYGTQNPENEGGKLWISQSKQQINPDFFTWVDKRIAYLDSVDMAIGFFITWAQHFTTFSREQFERFESYLIARYAAYPLLYWVIVGEFDEAGKMDDYNYHGQVIASRDPYGHLVTIHPGHNDPNNSGTNRIFVGQSWFSFVMQQLPQYPVYTSPQQVYRYILDDRIYNLPVVNAEFGYENKNYYGYVMTAEYVRKYAWSIVLGGGFLSYGSEASIRKVNLDALDSKGSTYMSYLFDFFKNINWWEMSPDTEHADYGFCLSSAAPEYIVYLPDSGSVNLDLSQDSVAFQSQWFNPQTSEVADDDVFEGGMVKRFASIYSHDGVLRVLPSPDSYLHVAPESLYFEAIQGYKNPPSQRILVTNTGGSTLSWLASEQPNQIWLTLNNISGGDGDYVTVAVNIRNLPQGTYHGKVRISDPAAANDFVDVPIKLWIKKPGNRHTISGTTWYHQDKRPVDNGLLTLTHYEGTDWDTTDVTGSYRFPGILEGKVQLVASKQQDLRDAITATDALSVLQYLAFLSDLSEDQKFAADVTRDGKVTATDALAILYYLTFFNENIAATGRWLFQPDTASFLLHADTLVNFRSYLLGDVNGDWKNRYDITAFGTEPDTTTTVLRLKHTNAADQSEIILSAVVTNLADTLNTLVLSIDYDSSLFSFHSARRTKLSEKFMLAVNGKEPGKVRIALAGVAGIRKSGEIVRLVFKLKSSNSTPKYSDLKIRNARINDKTVLHLDNIRIYLDDNTARTSGNPFATFQTYPNPFNQAIKICFDLPDESRVELSIFNLLGQKVITLIHAPFPPGTHSAYWNGADAQGNYLNSGIYFARISVETMQQKKAKSQTMTRKIFLLK